MLHSQNLSEFFTQNVHRHIYPTIFLMTYSGTLFGYSRPSDVGDLRSKAAILSQVWASKCPNTRGTFPQSQLEGWLGAGGYLNVRSQNQLNRQGEPAKQPNLETLTIETARTNILMTRIQENVILVLLGNNPPGAELPFRITTEFPGDDRYPSNDPSRELLESEADTWDGLTQYEKDIKLGALHIQRKKLDSVGEHLKTTFVKSNFVVPSNGVIP